MILKDLENCIYCKRKVKKSFFKRIPFFFESSYSVYCFNCKINYYHENNIVKKIDYFQDFFDAYYSLDTNETNVYLKHKLKLKLINQKLEEKTLEDIRNKIKKYLIFI